MPDPTQMAGAISKSQENTRGLSLHIGMNCVDAGHYNGWTGELTSCENDANAMAEIARLCGFESQCLKSAEATRDKVTQAIEAAADRLPADGLFWVSYSGHGGQVYDVDGDEADGKDDTWCLYDAQLLDDELHVLFSRFKPGSRVLVLSDSCHSGTLLKGERKTPVAASSVEDDFIHPRAMPRSAAIDVSRAQRGFYATIQQGLPHPRPRIGATVRLLSGCREDQESFGSATMGRFTSAVQTVYANGAFEGDYAAFVQQLIKTVARAMNPQTPGQMVIGATNRDFDRQKPFTI